MWNYTLYYPYFFCFLLFFLILWRRMLNFKRSKLIVCYLSYCSKSMRVLFWSIIFQCKLLLLKQHHLVSLIELSLTREKFPISTPDFFVDFFSGRFAFPDEDHSILCDRIWSDDNYIDFWHYENKSKKCLHKHQKSWNIIFYIYVRKLIILLLFWDKAYL